MKLVTLISISLVMTGCKKEDKTQTNRNSPSLASKPDDHRGHDNGHTHHGRSGKHADPGPRRLSSAELLGEKAQALAAIGPAPAWEDVVKEMVKHPETGNEMYVLNAKYCPMMDDGKQAQGCVFQGKTAALQRLAATPYALSPIEADTPEYKPIMAAIHTQMDHAEHFYCAQMVVNDLYEKTGQQLTETLDWHMVLHVTGHKGGKLIVDDVDTSVVEADPRMSKESIECYVAKFRGIEVEGWDRETNLYFDWPICVQPPQARASAESSNPTLN